MGPMISVCRKGDSVYLTLEGSFNTDSFHQMLQALKRMVMSTLEFSPPDSKVAFTFKTHGKVNLEKRTDTILLASSCNL